MEIHKKQSMWNYPWYAFSLSLSCGETCAGETCRLSRSNIQGYYSCVVLESKRWLPPRSLCDRDECMVMTFRYKACSKEEMTRLWNYHIEHENATPCYAITPRGEAKKPEEAIYEVYLSKINPVEAYIKNMGGSWFCGGWKWKKTVKEILNDSNKQTCA